MRRRTLGLFLIIISLMMKKILIWPARFPYSEYELFWQFHEIDMSECQFVPYVDVCRMIENYMLNVSTGADSEHGANMFMQSHIHHTTN
eukprot:413265-Prymnesium_polylepis.1